MSLLHHGALAAACALTVGGAATASAASTASLKAALEGASEIPEKGDADGSGTATVRIKGTQLCYSLRLSRVGSTAAGHIHRGRAGRAGAIVVPLYAGEEDRQGCVTVKAALAKEIARSPGAFYFNVHNKKFPGGAVRGQLTKR